MPNWTRIVTAAALLGWLPFAAGLAFAVWPELWPFDHVRFERAMIGYGALILAFLGGVRWGIRMQGGAGSDLTFVAGIVGAAVGFVTLLLPFSVAIALLIVAFGAQGAWDVWDGHNGGVPRLYARLRNGMTWLVCITLIAILLARVLV